MSAQVKFKREVKTVPFGENTMRIEHITPILSPKEKEKRRREVECKLYDVFIKYTNNKKLKTPENRHFFLAKRSR
ncbi:MAG: hypothetical protein FWC13_09975 [Oscillospiraceae bacterium]|nr:hypothetical protein [Oscillospiraceae bacterium]